MTQTVIVDDAVPRREPDEPPLYANRIKVHPKDVRGRFRTLKWAALGVLLSIYYILPWVRWDRGPNVPDQAVLVDMANRRTWFFFIELWPQEVYYFTGLLVLAALGLFLVTSLAGRVWCGYACPQTVWTDLFLWVERRIEGDRNTRIKLDAQPFGWRKAGKRIAKHTIWLIIAALTGGAWIMYFNDAPTVVREIFTGQASATVYGFVALFTGTTYLLAGWAREQVCTYMCPWPRFQAAMFDEDTLVVTYQRHRGEPRGKLRKGPLPDGQPVGDCVACNQCVAVCPTGIDIRDGIQLECIGCALCVDACDAVMDKIGKPRGLIGYDTERNRMNRAAGRPTEYRLFRARTAIYATLLTIVGVFMLWGLTTRPSLDVNVLHDRSPLFVTLSNGDIRNGYTVKVLNMSRSARTFALEVEGVPGAAVAVAGTAGDAEPTLTAAPDSVATHQVFVRLPRTAVTEEVMPITFRLRDGQGETATHDAVFRGPKP